MPIVLLCIDAGDLGQGRLLANAPGMLSWQQIGR
jgi:hypothetical protein